MTVGEFIELLESVTYKPGEEVRWLNPPDRKYPYDGTIRIALCRNVPDSKNPGERMDIQHHLVLTETDIDMLDMDYAKYRIYRLLADAEIHECEEFLKFAGEQYRDPHADGG